ncbi:MAG: histone deacetylase family protein [Candidatus Krumholzibacteria bacterium]|nr:histone deacetylase family protein [Candidatus Krumholzibacteria bacterium]
MGSTTTGSSGPRSADRSAAAEPRPAPVPLMYHPALAAYDFGEGHPFSGERFTRFMAAIEGYPDILSRLTVTEPSPAGDDLIGLAHSLSYIEMVRALERRSGYLSVDTRVMPGSVEAARMIVGASVGAVTAARRHGLALSFGGLHHAGRDYGEGFCIFNDVAVAALHLLQSGIERVMVIDTDAHQGNGTMDIFYEDPRVLFVSLHQDPMTLYPGTGFVTQVGKGEGKGFTVNVPMPVRAGDSEFRIAIREIVIPLIDRFSPRLIIRNGGSDPLKDDILTDLGLSLDGLSLMTGTIAAAARDRGIPLADLFLSGYGSRITEGWLAIVRGTLGLPIDIALPDGREYGNRWNADSIRDAMLRTLEQLKRELRPYWGDL